MKNFFILGNNPTLSIAEISAIYPNNESGEIISREIFFLEEEINSQELIKKLGGTIKIGKITDSVKGRNFLKIQEEILKIISTKLPYEGKFKFGISYYGKNKLNIKPLGMEVKKFLKESGTSCRWVISREKVLSSVVVEQNKLVEKGIEIVLIAKGDEIIVGYTEAVQDFKGLSKRDFGRPARDDLSGMIPPKLAQIMLNMSGNIKEDATVLDPFCGSGTILMEALLMGVKKVIGSDISEKAIKDSKENTEWVINNYQLENIDYKFLNTSATKISKDIKKDSVDAIVMEPYLGPQRGYHNIQETIDELNKLYGDAISEFKKILKENGTIVMIWPVFMERKGNRQDFMNPQTHGLKIINAIPKYLKNENRINLTQRNTIIYGRDGQKVHREIVILKKASK